MKRPEEVWIGAKRYKITYDHTESRIRSADMRKDVIGYSNHHELVLVIDPEAAEAVIRDTLMHEIFHCIWNDAGIQDIEMTEEDIVGCVTPRFVSMLRVNPDVVKYLMRTS